MELVRFICDKAGLTHLQGGFVPSQLLTNSTAVCFLFEAETLVQENLNESGKGLIRAHQSAHAAGGFHFLLISGWVWR